MKIVLSGSTGFIGKTLTRRLASNGHEIVCLTRNPEKYKSSNSKNISYIKWNARTTDSWAEVVDSADAVINLAGEPIDEKRWTRYQKEWILNSRIESTNAVVEAISMAKNQPSTLINASAVGYYGDVKSCSVDESHPRGTGFLADVCELWENAAKKAEKYNTRVVMLRTGVVLESDGGALKRMLSAFKAFASGTPGSGSQWVPWIHRKDVISAIEFILKNNSLSGPVNISSPNPVTMKELATTIGEILHKPMWAPIPSFVVKAALGEMAEMLLTGQKVIPFKLIEAGFEFKYPYLKDALKDILL